MKVKGPQREQDSIVQGNRAEEVHFSTHFHNNAQQKNRVQELINFHHDSLLWGTATDSGMLHFDSIAAALFSVVWALWF